MCDGIVILRRRGVIPLPPCGPGRLDSAGRAFSARTLELTAVPCEERGNPSLTVELLSKIRFGGLLWVVR